MDERATLHTAARQYCQDRWSFWVRRYKERAIGVDHPEAQNMYPRYNVLAAILVDVESVEPDDVDTVDALRSVLVMAGQTAEDAFTRAPQSAIAARAMQEERALFSAYVCDLSLHDVAAIEPLPYHRSLSPAEHTQLWSQLRKRWGLREGGYWHPLIGEDLPPHVVAFQQAWFDHAVPPAVLQGTLRQHGVAHVWELREFGPEYEIDLDDLEPASNGAEGYWTAGDMDWLVYASHESSITVAGAWLIAALKGVWPAWEQHPYMGWNYEPPPHDGR